VAPWQAPSALSSGSRPGSGRNSPVPTPVKMNTNLMTAKIMKRSQRSPKIKSRQFESARSRRGSEYVDDFNLNDTLFFDGAEEVGSVSDYEDDEDDEMDVIAEGDDDDDEELEDVFSPQPMDPSLGGLSLDEDEETDTELSFPKMTPNSPMSPNTPGSPKSPPMIHEDAPAKVDAFRLSGVVKVDAAALMAHDIDGDGDSLHSDEDNARENGRVFEVERDGESEKQILLFIALGELVDWEPISNGVGLRIRTVRVKESEEARLFAQETGIEGREWTAQIVNGDNVREMVKECIEGLLEKCDVGKGYRVTFVKNVSAKRKGKGKKGKHKRKDSNLKPSMLKKGKKKKSNE